jgi:hypothetical protein
MRLSFRDKQILLYEGGYIDSDFIDTANNADYDNLIEDFLEAAKTMDKEIEAGNFITVDKQFVMNNVGMFRGIHEADHAKSERRVNYVFNFEFEDAQSFDETKDVSLIFDPTEPVRNIIINDIIAGLEPLKVFEHQFSDDWQFVPFLEQWGENVLNWNGRHLKELLGISE